MDKEAPVVVDDQHLRLLVNEESEVDEGRLLLGQSNALDVESDHSHEHDRMSAEDDIVALLNKQHALFLQRVEDLRKGYMEEVKQFLKDSRK